jgi:hypothetical protein
MTIPATAPARVNECRSKNSIDGPTPRENEARELRAAEECKLNRHVDPFIKDNERIAHLQKAAVWRQEITRLEFEERCELPAGGSAGPNNWKAPSGYFHGADH